MVSVYVTFALCMYLFIEGNRSEQEIIKPSPDRLTHNRNKAKGLMDRNNVFKRKAVMDKRSDMGDEAVRNDVDTAETLTSVDGGSPLSETTKREITPKCTVKAEYPYDKSPVVDIVGVTGMFNSILVGYQSPHAETRENKGSVFGLSTIAGNTSGKRISYSFRINYAPLTVDTGPTSYCALIMQPPLEMRSSILRTLDAPPRHKKRNVESTDALIKFLKTRKTRIVAKCCFVVSHKDPDRTDQATNQKR